MRERNSAFTKRVPLILLLAASACVVAPLLMASNGVAYALCWGAAICNIFIALMFLRETRDTPGSSPTDNYLFHEIVQNTTDVVGIANLQGEVVYLNAAGRTTLGVGLNEDLSGRKIADFHPPWAAREILEKGIPAAMAGGVWQGETVLRTRTGQEIPVSQVVMTQRDARGKPVFLATVIRDITQLKEAERSAREGAELARRAEEFSLVMVVRCAPDGRWLNAPARLCKLLGYSEEELLTMGFSDVTHRDDLERLWTQCKRVERGEIQSFELEKRCICKDGTELWTYVNSTGVFSGDGKLLYFQAYLRDITEQKKNDTLIKQSERRFRSVFESPVMGMLLWSGEEIQDANDCFLAMMGYTREDIHARPLKWRELTPPELLYLDEAALKSIQTRGGVEPYEKEYFRKDGSRVPILICPMLTEPDKGGGVAFVLDISAKRRAENELRETAERLTLIAEATNDALWDREIGTGKSWWNDAYRKYFGFENEILPTYENWMSRVHPEDIERVLATLKSAEKGQSRETWSAEYRYKLADGTYGHVLDRAIILRDAKGVAYRIAGAMQDLTARVKAEESIRRLAERLELVSKATNDSVWDRNLRTGEGWWNEVYASRYGLEEGRLPTLDHWLARVHPDDRPRVIANLNESQASNSSSWTCEYRVQLPDGSYAQILDRALVVRDAAGIPVRVIGSSLDLTERVKAQAALQESERRLATTIGNLPGMVYRCLNDRDWSMEYISENCEDITGYKAQDFLNGKPTFNDIYHPDDRDMAWEIVQAAILRRGKFELNYRIRTAGGEWKWMQEYGRAVFGGAGELLALEGIIFDNTNHRRLQDALQENEERYRLLFKNAPEAITILDLKTGRFVDHNAGAEKLFKMTSEELLSVGPADVSPPRQPDGAASSERALALCEEAMRGGSPRFEWTHLDKQGRPVPCEIWLTRLPSKDRLLVRGSIVDISGRKLLEEQLRQAQKMEAVGKLAGGIAHDFNNLLVAIIGYGDLIRTQAAEGSSQRMGADQILIAAQRAADLTRQLLAYSRKQILQPKIISLSKTVSDMHRLLERLIGEDIEFVQVLEASGSVSADPGQIEQVIMNLVLNARDAMPKGGRLTIETLDVELDDNYRRQHSEVVAGAYVMLAVSDTGVGMTKDTIDRIFEPFFTTKEVGKGTGLGLSTVYGIVKQSGGHVFVYSEPGAGSTFKIYLPRLKAVNAVESTTQATAPAHGQETILVVEDEDGVRKLVIEVLKRAGYKTLDARDGATALKVAEEYAGVIDLLVTDVVLPKMGGSAVARELQKVRPTLRVLFMSGYTENAVVHHGVLDDGIEYLQKPFMPSEFARRVRVLLDKPSTQSGASH